MNKELQERIAKAAKQVLRGKHSYHFATASHILVRDQALANRLLQSLQQGGDFAKLAREHSICPSKRDGGSLGEFRRGDMAMAFDKAVFQGDVGPVIGPIKTKFGYHLIRVHGRR